MPVNPNKDQQMAFAFFEDKLYIGGRFKQGMHEGEILRIILTKFAVGRQALMNFIQDAYVEPGLLEIQNKIYSEVGDDV